MSISKVLSPEEYVEQAYLFKALMERMSADEPIQELLGYLREEILATTKLPMAIDFLLAEVKQLGTMATAMKRIAHYFTPYQSFLIGTAEDDHAQLQMRSALHLLYHDAKLRSEHADRPTMFFHQFESLCRHSLDYDYGLQAIAVDPIYDDTWQRWILGVRHKLGMVDMADLVYIHSEYYLQRKREDDETPDPILFGEKEGRIALANRTKETHYLFLALQRQLGYPPVPLPQKVDPADELIPKLKRMVERLEVRVKFLEDEQRNQGIDLSKFYKKNQKP
ncbi:hypothetical protein [Mariniblastus fucicola]|uniref:Uncharacterized protein n=1 Tax=Mariniblastus fucicola TaxID=980251 RepID=A0A5B9PCF6_9BACT|nr:hypothetical protein [Mariniblastus fucicola]QEG22602.1 hypothetical protein MFFC18_24850 [Mariniblastus fucicola]